MYCYYIEKSETPPPKKNKMSTNKNGSHFKIFGVVSRFLYSGGWQVCTRFLHVYIRTLYMTLLTNTIKLAIYSQSYFLIILEINLQISTGTCCWVLLGSSIAMISFLPITSCKPCSNMWSLNLSCCLTDGWMSVWRMTLKEEIFQIEKLFYYWQ